MIWLYMLYQYLMSLSDTYECISKIIDHFLFLFSYTHTIGFLLQFIIIIIRKNVEKKKRCSDFSRSVLSTLLSF